MSGVSVAGKVLEIGEFTWICVGYESTRHILCLCIEGGKKYLETHANKANVSQGDIEISSTFHLPQDPYVIHR